MTIRELIKWALHAPIEEMILLQEVINYRIGERESNKEYVEAPQVALDMHKHAVKAAYAGVMKKRRQTKKRVSKSRRITRRSYDDFSPRAINAQRVWEALKQSSGALSAGDIASYLGDMSQQRASGTLCALYKGRHKRVLRREKHTKTGADGGGVWEWRYTYTGG